MSKPRDTIVQVTHSERSAARGDRMIQIEDRCWIVSSAQVAEAARGAR